MGLCEYYNNIMSASTHDGGANETSVCPIQKTETNQSSKNHPSNMGISQKQHYSNLAKTTSSIHKRIACPTKNL